MTKLVITMIPGAVALVLIVWLGGELVGLVELSPVLETILVFGTIVNLLFFLL